MDKKSIKEKELRRNSNNKYFYITLDKPKEHSGETVEEFLARGGAIKKIVNVEKGTMPQRGPKGRFLKKEVNE